MPSPSLPRSWTRPVNRVANDPFQRLCAPDLTAAVSDAERLEPVPDAREGRVRQVHLENPAEDRRLLRMRLEVGCLRSVAIRAATAVPLSEREARLPLDADLLAHETTEVLAECSELRLHQLAFGIVLELLGGRGEAGAAAP